MEKMQTQELISALADGQLQGEAFARAVELAACDPLAREAWHTYHLIGDVLRSGELTAGTTPTAFLERLQLRLRQEQRLDDPQPVSHLPGVIVSQPSAANDDSFRWKLVAGLASVAAVAAIGWAVIGGAGGKPEQAQLAAAQPVAAPASSPQTGMIRDPRLDEFLAAHRQLGGASALQMPAGLLRNATYEGSNR
jgi:sigma-E factor negative regulatory protein RseA